MEGFISIGGHMCSHMIYFHKISPKAEVVLKLLEALKQEHESDAEHKEEDETDPELLDDAIHELLELLEGEMVVVVTECTC